MPPVNPENPENLSLEERVLRKASVRSEALEDKVVAPDTSPWQCVGYSRPTALRIIQLMHINGSIQNLGRKVEKKCQKQ